MAKGSRSYRLFLEVDFLLALPALYTVHCTVMGSWSTYTYNVDHRIVFLKLKTIKFVLQLFDLKYCLLFSNTEFG